MPHRGPYNPWLPQLLARAAQWLCVASVVMGCSLQSGTELLTVTEIEPAEVQLGEEFALLGDGFALSRSASVHMRGTVYRAGADPTLVDVALPAETETQRRLRLRLPPELQPELCGRLHEARHATFRGEIEVAIASQERGAPPIVGTLRGAVVELYPHVTSQEADERGLDRGARVRSFFGVDLSESQHGGVVVVSTRPGGKADRAGLRPGDRILEVDGVTVLQPSDLAPGSRRLALLRVDRAGAEHQLSLDVDGFQPTPAGRIRWLVAGAWGLALSLVLCGSALCRGWLRRLRQLWAPQSVVLGSGQWSRSAWVAGRNLLLWVSVVAAVLGAQHWLWWGRGWPPVAAGVLLFVSACALVTQALWRSGQKASGFSLRVGLRAAAREAAWAGLALVSVVAAGTYAALEATARLGTAPRFSLLLSPESVLLLASAVGCSVTPGQLELLARRRDGYLRRALELGGAWGWLHCCALSCLLAWALSAASTSTRPLGADGSLGRWLALCAVSMAVLTAWRLFLVASPVVLHLRSRALVAAAALAAAYYVQQQAPGTGLLLWLRQALVPVGVVSAVAVLVAACALGRRNRRCDLPSLWV